MLSPNDHDALHNPKANTLTDEAITLMIDDAIKVTASLPIRIMVPRHSIDRAATMAEVAGWSTDISTVRSIEVDAPDMLILSHRRTRR